MHSSVRLNIEQRTAVETGNVPVLIVAGPGTGKTKTLTARIAYLLTERRVKLDEVVALTFTNKAAREMRERLEVLFDRKKKLPKVTTFHALSSDILRQAGLVQKLLTEAEQQEIIRVLPKQPHLKSKSTRELSLLISRLRTSPNRKLSSAENTFVLDYEAALQERQVHDYDDLLIKTVELLKARHPRPDRGSSTETAGLDSRRRGNDGGAWKFKYLLVDEFQDTSELQYEMLKLLVSENNIFAIGDPNQSIYSFRGAGGEMFVRFRADFPATTTIALTSNYRSQIEIVNLANAVFPDSPQLIAESGGSGTVRCIQTLNEYSEAKFVLGKIERGIGGTDLITGNSEEFVCEPRDYAVLYRTHRAGKVIQDAFESSGIPYQIAGEGSPYERPEVQLIITALRYLHTPGRAPIPKVKGLNDSQTRVILKKLTSSAGRKQFEVCEYIPFIAEAFGFELNRHLQQLQSALVQFQSDTGAALNHIDDIAESEFYDPTVNAVTLMTIHAAKGLEFTHVFLIAAEEGILPKLDSKGNGDIGEERRLFYVAATRAKENLDILYAKLRSNEPTLLSRFVHELPAPVLPRVDDPNMLTLEKRFKKRAAKHAQGSLF